MLARMRTRATAAALLLTACAGTPLPDVPPAPSAVASAEPAPAASATASAAPVDDAPSPYFPWAVHGMSLRLFPLTHGAAIVSGSYLAKVATLGAGGATLEPRFKQGIKGVGEGDLYFAVTDIAGDWPRSAEMGINLPGDRGGDDYNYAWTGSTWVKAKRQPHDGMSQRVLAAYYQGGFYGAARWNGHVVYYLHAADGVELVPEARAKGPTPAKGSGKCGTRLLGYGALLNDKAGDLVGIGKLCTGVEEQEYMSFTGPGALAVERWKKASATSTVTTLPGSEGKGTLGLHRAHLVEGAANRHFVLATLQDGDKPAPYAAEWDGKEYRDISPPAGEPIGGAGVEKDGSLWIEQDTHLAIRRGGVWEDLAPPGPREPIALHAVAPDGTHWLRRGATLWHRDAAGSWERALLPRGAGKERMVAASLHWVDGELLIIADDNAGAVLLGARKPEKVLDLDADEGTAAKAPEPKGPLHRVGPPVPGCKSLFVVLYKLSRVAPKDFDFPLTREALKGHTEYEGVRFAETEDAGSRYFVAFVPDLGKGRSLVKLIGDKVAGSKPQLLCGEPPQTNRKIEIDLRTGAIKK
jgi:hypothetical protein